MVSVDLVPCKSVMHSSALDLTIASRASFVFFFVRFLVTAVLNTVGGTGLLKRLALGIRWAPLGTRWSI